MNILYEGLKQKGGMMVVPSSIVDSMGPAGVMSLAALAKGQRDSAEEEEEKTESGKAEDSVFDLIQPKTEGS
jgi:hypothetical protein